MLAVVSTCSRWASYAAVMRTPHSPARASSLAPPPIAVDAAAAAVLVAEGAAMLDARDAAAFADGHAKGAGRLEPHEFAPRRAELPPRDHTVLLVHDRPESAARAAEALHALGYSRVHWLDAPLSALPDGHSDKGSAARLWRPSPFLERIAPQLPRAGSVLDLASGSGRESVWMACRGHEVHAWDHAPEALERAEALAAREGVRLRPRLVDLEHSPRPDPGQHAVVMVFRFLHRPILPWIAAAVAPGGMLVYETYARGQERFGRPRHPRFLFQPGEIATAFPGLRNLVHEEPRPEGGPMLARLLAVRD